MFARKQLFRRVAIVGAGFMGASLGLAIKKKGLAKEIIGIGHHETSLREAVDVGAIDESTMDLMKGILGADLIILATPVNTIVDVLDILAPPIQLARIALNQMARRGMDGTLRNLPNR